MKLRADFSLFLALILLSSTLSYSDDYFSVFPSVKTIEVVEEVRVPRNGGGGRSRSEPNYTYLPDKLKVIEEVYNKKFKLDTAGMIDTTYFLGADLTKDRYTLPTNEYVAKSRFYNSLRFKDIEIKGTDIINIRERQGLIQYNAEYIRITVSNESNFLEYFYPQDLKPLLLAPDDTKVTVTGVIYHPGHAHLSTDFTLNFYKTVTDHVYRN